VKLYISTFLSLEKEEFFVSTFKSITKLPILPLQTTVMDRLLLSGNNTETILILKRPNHFDVVQI